MARQAAASLAWTWPCRKSGACSNRVVAGAGFGVGEVVAVYEEGRPKVLGADVLGVAVSP